MRYCERKKGVREKCICMPSWGGGLQLRVELEKSTLWYRAGGIRSKCFYARMPADTLFP